MKKMSVDGNRREFLAKAGLTAAAGVATAAFARAAGGRRPQRVAIVGAGHYHTILPPNYIAILQREKVEIVGVHDPDRAVAEDRAKRSGSKAWTDYRMMIEQTKPEFVLALGRHADMPPYFRYLVDTGIPFLMEKPWGVDAATVNALADYAEKKKAWAAVPMSMRYTWWAHTAREMFRRGELGTVSHMLVRFNQPGIQRYIDAGNEWMLSKKLAGGGALVNLGIHGFDLCRYITGEEPKVVSAVTSHAIWKREVEDYAFVTLRTPGGIVFLNEASYTYPTSGSDQEHKIAGRNAVVTATLTGDGVRIVAPGRDETIQAPKDFIGSWPGVVNDCLNRIGRGEPPPATARDCARAVSLTFDAYRMAGEGLS